MGDRVSSDICLVICCDFCSSILRGENAKRRRKSRIAFSDRIVHYLDFCHYIYCVADLSFLLPISCSFLARLHGVHHTGSLRLKPLSIPNQLGSKLYERNSAHRRSRYIGHCFHVWKPRGLLSIQPLGRRQSVHIASKMEPRASHDNQIRILAAIFPGFCRYPLQRPPHHAYLLYTHANLSRLDGHESGVP